jgi:hypothetical protein
VQKSGVDSNMCYMLTQGLVTASNRLPLPPMHRSIAAADEDVGDALKV